MEVMSDAVLAEKLREEDPEQFYTLVRMHLSFVLDLSTEEYDGPVEKSKFLPLKWNQIFSRKGKGGSRNGIEGVPLSQRGIRQVYELLRFLRKEENIVQEGIFRRSGAVTRQQELKSLVAQDLPLSLESGYFSVHDCATVLKNFLADLPESLLTEAHYPAYCQIAEFCTDSDAADENRLLLSLQFLMLLLPMENRFLLKELLDLLHLASEHEAQNKMSAENLATLFTPHLLCPRRLTREEIHANSLTMSGVVAFMIRESDNLFNIPQKLALDIRSYWVEKNRVNSPLMNNSTTANTVFTFVDRSRSAQDDKDATATALAQLYAHIQSLPESTKKRRLLKKFNKGTPLSHQSRNQNLSDSIKKHIPVLCKSSKHQKHVMKDEYSTVHSLSQDIFSTPRSMGRSLEDELSFEYSGVSLCNLFRTRRRVVFRLPNSPKTPKSKTEDVSKSASVNEAFIGDSENVSSEECLDNVNEDVTRDVTEEQEVECDAVCDVRNDSSYSTGSNPRMSGTECGNTSLPSLLSYSSHVSHLPRLASTPANSEVNLHVPPVDITDGSMSPITRSARKMPKAMQEAIMTPRNRNPVMLLSGSNICQLSSLSESCSSGSKDEGNSHPSRIPLRNLENMDVDNCSCHCGSDGSAPFTECSTCFGSSDTYDSVMMSHSLFTATPVDLSFCSRTGDFDSCELDEENAPPPHSDKSPSSSEDKLGSSVAAIDLHRGSQSMRKDFCTPVHETTL